MSRFLGFISKVLPRSVAKHIVPAVRQQAAMDSRIQARSQLQSIMQDWSRGKTGEISPGGGAPNAFDAIKVSADADITTLSADEVEKLAGNYFKGIEGCPLDRPKAVELWSKAAEMGNWQAQFCIASCKLTGEGIAKDPVGAFKIFEDIAKKNKAPMAEFQLASLYISGEGGEQNFQKAHAHMMIAAESGFPYAVYHLALLYATGKGVAQNDEVARGYFESAAKAGLLEAKATLARWLIEGRGGEKDPARAFQMNLESAERGVPLAMYAIAVQYHNGDGVDKNLNLALYWYDKASAAGMFLASANAGNMYKHGIGVDRDLHQALAYFKKGMESNMPECKKLYEETLELIAKEDGARA